MNRTILITIVFSLFLMQCKKNKPVSQTVDNAGQTPAVVQNPASAGQLRKINADLNYTWPGTTDNFTLTSSEIHGDSLILMVEYGGGCKEHQFTMNTNMRWMKSMPPQLNLYLEHESNDDLCRAMINEKLVFDISGCRYTPGNAVILIINENREKRLQYRY